MKNKTFFRLSMLISSVLILLLTVACEDILTEFFHELFGDSVTIPEKDQSPPTVYLFVSDQGFASPTGRIEDGGEVNLIRMGTFIVSGVAEDPEGVKSISMGCGVSFECTDRPGGEFLGSPEKITFDAMPGEIGPTRLVFPYTKRVTNPCGGDESNLISWQCPLDVIAENFSGGTTRARININFRPTR